MFNQIEIMILGLIALNLGNLILLVSLHLEQKKMGFGLWTSLKGLGEDFKWFVGLFKEELEEDLTQEGANGSPEPVHPSIPLDISAFEPSPDPKSLLMNLDSDLEPAIFIKTDGSSEVDAETPTVFNQQKPWKSPTTQERIDHLNKSNASAQKVKKAVKKIKSQKINHKKKELNMVNIWICKKTGFKRHRCKGSYVSPRGKRRFRLKCIETGKSWIYPSHEAAKSFGWKKK